MRASFREIVVVAKRTAIVGVIGMIIIHEEAGRH